jgi:hypothetical protein
VFSSIKFVLQNIFYSIECVQRLSDSVLQNTFYRSEHILQFSSIECVLRLSDSVLQNTFYRSEHILQKRTHSIGETTFCK